jgi:hypothetical protein
MATLNDSQLNEVFGLFSRKIKEKTRINKYTKEPCNIAHVVIIEETSLISIRERYVEVGSAR